MEFVPNAEELAHVFSVATGPAFFLGAITALISIILGRLNSVVARIKEIDIGGDAGKLVPNNEILALDKRADALSMSLYLSLGGGVCTLALLAYMSFGEFFKLQQLYGAGLLFVVATFLVAGSLLMLALDVRRDLAHAVANHRKKIRP